jgi:glycosyltransferase involved in cell wall biosynthesis
MIPPHVPTIQNTTNRPFWSVMIPTYNCAAMLKKALNSVLEQDPGSEIMQIEVIDDASNLDDPETVVRQIAGDRVAFHRKSANGGPVANFNTCIERSRGHLVHILHGDDWVFPGFYETIEQMAHDHPTAGLYATRLVITNEEEVWTGISPELPNHSRQPSSSISDFWLGTPLQFAGVVIRRSSFEELGGFLTELCHTADWEMWTRIIKQKGGIVSPSVLGAYRQFPCNDTGRLKRTAENIRDRDRLNAYFATNHTAFPKELARRYNLYLALVQHHHFKKLSIQDAADANMEYWRDNATVTDHLKWYVKRIYDIIVRGS